MFLVGGGETVKMVKIDGSAVLNPILCLKPLTAEMHQHLTKHDAK